MLYTKVPLTKFLQKLSWLMRVLNHSNCNMTFIAISTWLQIVAESSNI